MGPPSERVRSAGRRPLLDLTRLGVESPDAALRRVSVPDDAVTSQSESANPRCFVGNLIVADFHRRRIDGDDDRVTGIGTDVQITGERVEDRRDAQKRPVFERFDGRAKRAAATATARKTSGFTETYPHRVQPEVHEHGSSLSEDEPRQPSPWQPRFGDGQQ